MPEPTLVADLGTLVARAERLAGSPVRRVLGVTGPPGAGKSTLAAAVVDALGPRSALVPMDGFHLRQAELADRGLAEVKGAPETFDAAAYVALLRDWRDGTAAVSAPGFDRAAEEPVPDAVQVPAEVGLLVTEGNYLLLETGPWSGLRELLDECWYVELADDLRVPRLVARQAAYGKPPDDAQAWARGSDARNAEIVAASRDRADVVVDLAALALPG